MQLIYSKDGAVIDGVSGDFRNPAFFQLPENGVNTVLMDMEYPLIHQAYEAMGADVSLIEADVNATGKKAVKGKGNGD